MIEIAVDQLICHVRGGANHAEYPLTQHIATENNLFLWVNHCLVQLAILPFSEELMYV